MVDREKVIKGLECCEKDEDLFICGECPYIEEHKFGFDCVRKMCRDALALLKEQEAVVPIVSTAEQRCGHCNKVIEMDGWKACPWCGKRIDWESWWSKNGTRNQDT